MAIKDISESGKGPFTVSVNVYSTKDRKLRKQKYKSGINTLSEAKRIERQLTHQAHEELAKLEDASCSWESLIDSWEIALRSGIGFMRTVTDSTREDYVYVLRSYTKRWYKLPANEISPADVREVFMDMFESGKSRARQQRLKTSIDGAFKWGIENRKVRGVFQSPALGVSLIGKKEEKKPQILNLNEIRTLLEVAKMTGHCWYPIWAAALLTGCRSGELFALEWSDVDLDNKRIMIHKSFSKRGYKFGPTKGRYWREVPISAELEKLLKELKAKRGHKKWVLPHHPEWTSGQQAAVLREFCAGIGITSVNFHALRACFATQLIRDKVAPAIVMKICGWKDLKTMQRYVRLAGIEVEGATEALKFLPSTEVMGRVVDLFQQSPEN